ncbi:MAG: hypothetical protein ACWGQW_25360 [bacterium]
MDNQYRGEFLAALNEIAGEPMQPGDMSVVMLRDLYGCSETKAYRIMRDAERAGVGHITWGIDENNRRVRVLRPTERIEDEPGMQEGLGSQESE